MNLVVVGAHALDAELMAGCLAAVAAEAGWSVLFIHLTRGERGHPEKPAAEFGVQLEGEMSAAAAALGCRARWSGASAPLQSVEVVPRLAQWLIECDPQLVVTHWNGSWHRSHRQAHDATLQALADSGLHPAVAFGENCEDLTGFDATHFVPAAHVRHRWLQALRCYELFRHSEPGHASDPEIPYWAYYTAALQVRGLQSGLGYAQAFMVVGQEVPKELGFVSRHVLG